MGSYYHEYSVLHREMQHLINKNFGGTDGNVYEAVLLSVSGRPMVVSSGMQSMETMRRVYKTVKEHNENFAILQCTSAYPLEPEDVNLRVIAVNRTLLL